MSDNINISPEDIVKAVIDSEPISGLDDLPADWAEEVPIENITEESSDDAQKLINNISSIYNDEDFLKNNPKFTERLNAEVENLRVLIKMRKTDEITHDNIVRAISKKPENASLYRALTDLQRTILNVSKQIDDKVDNINKLVKSIQLEFNFDNQDSEENEDTSSAQGRYRGSKDFIEDMKKSMSQ